MTKNDAFAQRMVGFALDRGWKPNEEDLAPFMERLVKDLEAKSEDQPPCLVGWRYRVLVNKHATGIPLPGEISMLNMSRQAVWGIPGQWRYSDGPNKPDVDWMCVAEPLFISTRNPTGKGRQMAHNVLANCAGCHDIKLHFYRGDLSYGTDDVYECGVCLRLVGVPKPTPQSGSTHPRRLLLLQLSGEELGGQPNSTFIDSFGYCQLCGHPAEECGCEAPAGDK